MKYNAAILLLALATTARALLYTPTNVTVMARSSGVELGWDMVEGAKEYVVSIRGDVICVVRRCDVMPLVEFRTSAQI